MLTRYSVGFMSVVQFEELSVVLSAFEGNAFSSDDLERSRDLLQSGAGTAADRLDSESAASEGDHFFQPKYLTNSRLFRLQLRDPILRECMLTQFLILFSYLSKAKLPAAAATPKSRVAEMQDRVRKLLQQTPSDGQGFSDMVARVLERERNWTKWKLEKCPPYEKFAVPTSEPSPAPTKPGARPILAKRVARSSQEDTALLEQILTESSKPSQILEKIKGAERGAWWRCCRCRLGRGGMRDERHGEGRGFNSLWAALVNSVRGAVAEVLGPVHRGVGSRERD